MSGGEYVQGGNVRLPVDVGLGLGYG